MDTVLPEFDLRPATWCYLSSALIVTVYFRFQRLISLRNLDLFLLLMITPGLLLIQEWPSIGYLWLFLASGVLLLRLLIDGALLRRPRSPQNLNEPGLAFLCTFTVLMLLIKIAATDSLPTETIQTLQQAEDLVNRHDRSALVDSEATFGPGATILAAPAVGLSRVVLPPNEEPNKSVMLQEVAARIAAVLSHLAVVFGLVYAGYRIFGDGGLGLAMATLYVLMPCTGLDATYVNRVLPAGLLIWAIAFSDRPLIAGIFLGLASGTLFFPIFLLPIWIMYYRGRDAIYFAAAFLLTGAILALSFVFTAADADSFVRQILGSVDWKLLQFEGVEAGGFWTGRQNVYRIPVFATFVILVICLTMWTKKRSVEQLLASTTAVIVATQFWYPREGGQYVLWYLPLLILVVYRPSHLGKKRENGNKYARTDSLQSVSTLGEGRLHSSDDNWTPPRPVTTSSTKIRSYKSDG
ncbi:hypothetical protein [Calycomorphotria hydatis]|uniref:Uncharacterized protein n=1 Tax=Calycomorphotria hydatis TaxID=2528027 RepID=A0A517TA89_9PLAN|nr:hypothetical protein [Calycomorphotria hydatis]QDT65284.1 hypothetical protein V22_25320 [Calycomorphotria hydatis]